MVNVKKHSFNTVQNVLPGVYNSIHNNVYTFEIGKTLNTFYYNKKT